MDQQFDQSDIDTVNTIIAEHMGCDASKLVLDTNFEPDSIDQVELVMMAEDEFDIEIPDLEVGKNPPVTPRAILSLVYAARAQRQK